MRNLIYGWSNNEILHHEPSEHSIDMYSLFAFGLWTQCTNSCVAVPQDMYIWTNVPHNLNSLLINDDQSRYTIGLLLLQMPQYRNCLCGKSPPALPVYILLSIYWHIFPCTNRIFHEWMTVHGDKLYWPIEYCACGYTDFIVLLKKREKLVSAWKRTSRLT
jgi:hypothetical protein